MRSGRVACAVAFVAVLGSGAAMAEWRLEHEQRFDTGAPLDLSWWRFEQGFIRNRELQSYQARNAVVEGGALRLQGRREQVPNPQWREGSTDWRQSRRVAEYTSASIVSQRPLQFARVEVVARAPSGAGLWPAIWLLHEGADQYGEIDLFEAVGKHPDTVFAGVHWGRDHVTRRNRNDSRGVPGFEGTWRTHTLEWTPQAITVSLDGHPWFRFNPDDARLPNGGDPLRQPMRLHLNLALGGSWGGPLDDSKLPASFDIRSIRVWRWAPGEPPAPVPERGAASAERTAPPMRWGR